MTIRKGKRKRQWERKKTHKKRKNVESKEEDKNLYSNKGTWKV